MNFVTQTADGTNALIGERDIYMNGTAYLEDGSTVTVTVKDASTRMENVGNISYRKYIYPAHYFGLPKGTVITDLYFYFTNKDGSKVVKPEGSELGFQFRQAAE